MSDTRVNTETEQEPVARPWSQLALGAAAAAVTIGVALRFWADTPLWLDESLSANIAALGPDGWTEALRHDGHPPLYYALLWLWTEIFGSSDGALRALSGLMAVAILPLAYIAGYRLEGRNTGLAALVLFATSPFIIRYGTEARMYALLSLLALGLWVLGQTALKRPSPSALAGVSLSTAALLYTHYWSIWLLGAAGLGLLWTAKQVAPTDRADTAKVIGAVVVGGVLFLPWVPVLLDQAAHTGTPWGDRNRPAEVLSTTIFELGGGPRSESQLVGVALVALTIAGLVGLRRTGGIALPMRVAQEIRPLAWLVGATLVIGSAISWISSNTYQPRYAAVIVPFLLLIAARGVSRLDGRALAVTLGSIAAVSLAAAAFASNVDRSQAEELAAAVEADMGPADLVVFCPDQLGPANSRYLPDGLTELTYPSMDAPDRVDWRDYAERNAAADPAAFAAAIDNQAGDGAIWVVLSTGYRTFEGQCERVIEELSVHRAAETVVTANADRYEPAALIRFSAPTTPR